MRGVYQTAWIMQAIRHEKQKVFLQTSDRKLRALQTERTQNICMLSLIPT